jgi:hypothetical protein
MASSHANNLGRTILAGFLAWLVPGMGHLYLGDRRRGLILLIVLAATFWSGVAIGSVANTVDPRKHTAWFMAQIATGAHALAVLGWKHTLTASASAYSWQAEDVAVVYTGVAGLLNLLVILDALARADAAKPASVRGGPTARPSRGAT